MSGAERPIAAVLVDWGTSNMRHWAVDHSGNVVATHRSGDGMRTLDPDAFESVLVAAMEEHNIPLSTPVLMCGMVGSREGWADAGYMPVPADLRRLKDHGVRINTNRLGDVRILPGLALRDPMMPDVMRSEETQLLGLLRLGAVGTGRSLVCMPGSHAKWVVVDGPDVTGFHTSMTGELIAAAVSSTVLRHAFAPGGKLPDVRSDELVFVDSVAAALEQPTSILNALFVTRARTLFDTLGPSDSAAWLSGSVIGHDVAAAKTRYAGVSDVVLVGGGKQGPLYEKALRMAGFNLVNIDADEASIAGLLDAAHSIWPYAFEAEVDASVEAAR